MSFLIETTARRAATMPMPVTRVAATSVLTSSPAYSRIRPFTTTPALHKSATESVKDGIHKVDRAVSDKIVDGINVGGKLWDFASDAAHKAKEAGESIAGKSSSKASEFEGKAKGAASEVEGKAKGAAHQAAGKAKGAADEIKKNL